jgi:hypothetical protein
VVRRLLGCDGMTHKKIGIGSFVALVLVLAPAAGQALDLKPVNLALKGTPSESSTINYTSPYFAIDGIDGGDAAGYGATMTDADFHSWWQVDLGQSRHIGSLEIINRTDCCQDNMFPFVVAIADFPLIESDITDADGFTYPGVTRIVVGDAVRDKYIVPVHRTGQFVMIGLLREYTNLSLGEVKVFEEYNAAIGRDARQTTPKAGSGAQYISVNAVDNNIDGDSTKNSTAVAVTSTSNKLPYLDLTLDDITSVDTVDVWTTNTTCCSTVSPRPTFTLIASPTPLGLPSAALPAGANKISHIAQGAPATVPVGMKARYFRVQLDAVDALSIAELQVWPVARGSVGSYATMSSKNNSLTNPFNGVDFNLNPSGNDITQTDVKTAAQTDPSYDLDLGGDRYLETVKLWGLAAASSSTAFSVWTSEFNKFPAGATVEQLRANQLDSGAIEFSSVAASPNATVSIGQRARYLRITIQGANQVLGFNELEIFTTEGFVQGALNGGPFGAISGFHTRPNESVDVFAFQAGVNSGAGSLSNWTYVGSALSVSFPTLTQDAVAPLYGWALPAGTTIPAGASKPGGVLGLYAQAYDYPGFDPIAVPLRGMNQVFVNTDSEQHLAEEDPFWPHIRVPNTSTTPDASTTPPPYLTKPMGTTVSTSYYNTFASGTYRELPDTLAQFNSRYLSSGGVSATYYNVGDLGIGRKMTCAQPRWSTPGGSVSGAACAVSNYAPAKAAGSTSKAPIAFDSVVAAVDLMHKNLPPFATVVMVKRQGTAGAMFGVYVPTGVPPSTDTNKTKLVQTNVFLDSTGANTTAPNNCMACHGGEAGTNPLDLSKPSMFLPFDPKAVGDLNLEADLYNFGYDWQHQEESFRKLNAIVNAAAPTPAIADFISGTYGGKVTTSGTKANSNYVPLGWTNSVGQKQAYAKVIKPYCRGCHMSQTGLGFLKAADMEGLRAIVVSDVCKTHVMPHSQITMKKAWTSGARATLLSYFGRDDVDQNTLNAETCAP